MLSSESQKGNSALSRKPMHSSHSLFTPPYALCSQVNFLFEVAVSHSTSTPFALQIPLLSLHLSKRKTASSPDLQTQICLNPNEMFPQKFNDLVLNHAFSLQLFFFFPQLFSYRLLHPTCEDKRSWQVSSQRTPPSPWLAAHLATSHQMLASHPRA